MFKQACTFCKMVGAVAIVGALNWGLVGLLNVNLVERIFGHSGITKIVYLLVGLSGLMLLFSYFYVCPACKKAA